MNPDLPEDPFATATNFLMVYIRTIILNYLDHTHGQHYRPYCPTCDEHTTRLKNLADILKP